MRRLRSAPPLVVLASLAACGDQAAPTATGPHSEVADQTPEVTPAAQAIHTPDLATLDPAPMTRAEIEAAFGAPSTCAFSYSKVGDPVLAVRTGRNGPGLGVVKLHAELVRFNLEDGADIADGARLTAPGVRVEVVPLEGADVRRAGFWSRQNAEMRFELEEGLTAGYRGFYLCGRQDEPRRSGA